MIGFVGMRGDRWLMREKAIGFVGCEGRSLFDVEIGDRVCGL